MIPVNRPAFKPSMPKTITCGLTATQITYAIKRIESLRDSKIEKLEDTVYAYKPSEAVRDAERAEAIRQLAQFSAVERRAMLTMALDNHSGYRYNEKLSKKVSLARGAVQAAGEKVRAVERRAAKVAIKRLRKKFTEATDSLVFGGVVPTTLSTLLAELVAFEG